MRELAFEAGVVGGKGGRDKDRREGRVPKGGKSEGDLRSSHRN